MVWQVQGGREAGISRGRYGRVALGERRGQERREHQSQREV